MESIRCSRCAKEVPGTSQFCRRCGYTIAWRFAGAAQQTLPPLARRAVAAGKTTTLRQPKPARPAPVPRKTSGIGVMGVLAICGAGLFFTRLSHRSISTPTISNYEMVHSPSRVTTPPPYSLPMTSHSPVVTRVPHLPPPPQIVGPRIVIEPPRLGDPNNISRYSYPYSRTTEPKSLQKGSR